MFYKGFENLWRESIFPTLRNLYITVNLFVLRLSFVLVLSRILVVVFTVTRYVTYINSGEKLSAFECGFDPLSKMRSPFSTRFFLLVVLFLIFDVEIALLFPVLRALRAKRSILLLSSVGVFLIILLVGIFHEWNEGALDWIGSWTGKLNLSYWAHNPTMELFPCLELCHDYTIA